MYIFKKFIKIILNYKSTYINLSIRDLLKIYLNSNINIIWAQKNSMFSYLLFFRVNLVLIFCRIFIITMKIANRFSRHLKINKILNIFLNNNFINITIYIFIY